VRVLLVDDNASLRRVMRTYFRLLGAYLEAVSDGAAAVAFFEEGGQVDVVLLDYAMPRHDGLSVLPKLRAVCSVPIVLFTGSVTAPSAFKNLFNGVIDKSLTPTEILAELQRLTGEIT
jgi:CheY-like chemotaxis protein